MMVFRKLQRAYHLTRIYYDNWAKFPQSHDDPQFHRLKIALRFYIPWLRSMKFGQNAFDDKSPWITFQARHFLNRILTPKSRVFEYGSGGSTLYFASRVAQLVTVEHDKAWYQQVRGQLEAKKHENWTLLHIPPEPAPPDQNRDFTDPRSYFSSDEQFQEHHFYNYVTAIEAYPDESFDLIVVDGRARVSCIYHAMNKVAKEGYLLLDNSERDSYQSGKDMLRNWEPFVFAGPIPYLEGFVETSIWRRL